MHHLGKTTWNDMTWIKYLIWNIVITLLLFMTIDFVYTKFKGPIQIHNIETDYRVKHEVYHHALKPNYQGYGQWGPIKYKVCTDEHGFKVSCASNKLSGDAFDIAFIGDSFTEAVGMEYENTFVGMFAGRFRELKIANFGVMSYSPTIYLSKVKQMLNEGITFKHLFVFVDISDLQDDSQNYMVSSNGNVVDRIVSSGTKLEVGGSSKTSESKTFKQFIRDNLRLTSLVSKYVSDLIKLIKPANVERRSKDRSAWTYNSNSLGYGEFGVDGAAKLSVSYMKDLYELLKSKNIKLSVGVYPWPDQIFNDKLIGNKQSEIWREFCVNRCELYIDTFSTFAKLRDKNDPMELYNEYYIARDDHFNKSGNKLIFEYLRDSYLEYINIKQKALPLIK